MPSVFLLQNESTPTNLGIQDHHNTESNLFASRLKPTTTTENEDVNKKPSPDQLMKVYNVLQDTVSKSI